MCYEQKKANMLNSNGSLCPIVLNSENKFTPFFRDL